MSAGVLLASLLSGLTPFQTWANDGLYLTGMGIGGFSETQDAKNEGSFGGKTSNPDHSDEVAGVGAALGYEVSAWFGKLRAEIEIHYRFRYDFDENRPVIDSLPLAGLDSDLATATGLVNINYRFELWSFLNPYVGGGLGATYYRADSEFNDFGALGRSNKESTGTNFTWAINAGMLWQISERFDLVLGYRYIDMGEIEFGSFAGGGVDVVADYVSHDVILGLGYRF